MSIVGESARSISIRRARLRDLSDILSIHGEFSEELGSEDSDWFKALLESKSRRLVFLVAEVNGGVVGYCLAYKNRGVGYIENIAVRGDYSGFRLGSRLLSEVERVLFESGVRGVYLAVKDWNTSAVNFYLKHGYRVKGVVFWLSGSPERINTRNPDSEYTVIDVSASKIRQRLKHHSSTWSSLVDDVEQYIYRKKLYRSERALVVKKKSRVVAYALYSINSEIIVDTIALSTYSQLEPVEVVINSLGNIARAHGVKNIEIPVDASKHKLIELLVNTGLRVKETEYLLHKVLE
jgi:ribosomal protein S18 acetylase RimI-like enzyme